MRHVNQSDEAAAKLAWLRTIEFFNQHLRA
jgi:dienelactone hydrolase